MLRKLEALFARLFGASVAGKILGASALVAGLSALARLVAVARDLILAAQFGLGPTLDAFFIALMVYQFVIGVFLVAFNGAFMPTYVAVRTTEGEVMVKQLVRQTAKRIELASVNPAHPGRSLAAEEVSWVARILWSSQ